MLGSAVLAGRAVVAEVPWLAGQDQPCRHDTDIGAALDLTGVNLGFPLLAQAVVLRVVATFLPRPARLVGHTGAARAPPLRNQVGAAAFVRRTPSARADLEG